MLGNSYPLYIKQIEGKGWGVFCSEPIKKGTLFHSAAYIMIPGNQQDQINETVVQIYHYGLAKKASAIVLGFGSLFNHSSRPNVEWRVSYKNKVFQFKATKNIPADTELVHDYGWEKEHYKKFNVNG